MLEWLGRTGVAAVLGRAAHSNRCGLGSAVRMSASCFKNNKSLFAASGPVLGAFLDLAPTWNSLGHTSWWTSCVKAVYDVGDPARITFTVPKKEGRGAMNISSNIMVLPGQIILIP